MRMKTGTAICAAIMLSLTCQAEYRAWIDDEGHQIQAEFIQNVDGAVSLRTEQGKLIHVSISSLSAKDQEYVLSLTPPRIGVDVQELTDTHTSAFDVGDRDDDGDNDGEIVNTLSEFKATLTRDSMIAYNGKITAELYIIGSKSVSDQFVLLNKTVTDVKFDNNLDDTFVFNSGSVDFKNLVEGSTYGMQYAGYLVVLLDGSGRMFESKSNHSEFKENIALIRKQSKGSVINLPCNSVFN